MLRSIKELLGYKIQALDGDIGKVHDFYFDDETWIIRYMVADTGSWLSGKKVLIIPSLLGQANWETQTFPVSLNRDQIEKCPDIELDKPVSRQHETRLYEYYKQAPYWLYLTPQKVGSVPPVPSKLAVSREKKEKPKKHDSHLRSTKEVKGYQIEAKDGEIGHVEDFIIEDVVNVIRYMIIDTKDWLPGKKVLISPEWIERISWGAEKVYIELTREMIKNSPEFDPSKPVNRKIEERLYDYYGRPKYWD
jgi:uncharacterized protein YrrD